MPSELSHSRWQSPTSKHTPQSFGCCCGVAVLPCPGPCLEGDKLDLDEVAALDFTRPRLKGGAALDMEKQTGRDAPDPHQQGERQRLALAKAAGCGEV